MSQLKVLNVDALIQPVRILELGGVKHDVHQMSVENFLETSAALAELEKEDSGDNAKQVEKTIEMILRSVPTAPRELLVKVPLSSLQDIVAFVRGDEIIPVAEEPAPAVEGKAPGKGAKRPARK